jgi:hypothetical protein
MPSQNRKRRTVLSSGTARPGSSLRQSPLPNASAAETSHLIFTRTPDYTVRPSLRGFVLRSVTYTPQTAAPVNASIVSAANTLPFDSAGPRRGHAEQRRAPS